MDTRFALVNSSVISHSESYSLVQILVCHFCLVTLIVSCDLFTVTQSSTSLPQLLCSVVLYWNNLSLCSLSRVPIVPLLLTLYLVHNNHLLQSVICAT